MLTWDFGWGSGHRGPMERRQEQAHMLFRGRKCYPLKTLRGCLLSFVEGPLEKCPLSDGVGTSEVAVHLLEKREPSAGRGRRATACEVTEDSQRGEDIREGARVGRMVVGKRDM